MKTLFKIWLVIVIGLIFFFGLTHLEKGAVAQGSKELIIVDEFNGPDAGFLRGLAWDGTTLWSCTSPDGWSSTIYKHNLDENLSVNESYSPSTYTVGIVWINGTLWSIDNFTDKLIKHGATPSSIVATYDLNGRRVLKV